MKTKFLIVISFITVLSFFGFKNVEPSPSLSSDLKMEYLKTSNSTELVKVLLTNFSDIFENIDKVDIHFNTNEQYYYYTVYGTKNKKSLITLLKISDEYATNETFPLLKNNNETREYCYYSTNLSCVPYQIAPIAAICGIKKGNYCYVY